jgi:hypothetical protein
MKYTSNPQKPAKRKVVWPAIFVAVGIVGIIGWTVAKFQPSSQPVGISRQISAGNATRLDQAVAGTNADGTIDSTQLEVQLVEAQAEKAGLSERYLERNPHVLAQQKVIADLEDQLRNARH